MDESLTKRVVYYPGCFANYFEPQIGKAVVHILERNGFRVIVPKHRCCGIARVGYGDFDGARKDAARLVDILDIVSEQKYDIVTDCPSCSLAIKEDYPFLLDSEKAKAVSEKTHLLSRYLSVLHEAGEMDTDFQSVPMSVAYHAPCHLKAQGLVDDSIKLLKLIPELHVTDLARGCCGMAGTAGFKHRYYESSMRIGGELRDRIKDVGVQVVATDCGGCKLQIEQMADVEATHPAILIGKAYHQ